MDSDSIEQVKSAEAELIEVDNKYHENKGKKYIVMMIGIVLFFLLGLFAMPTLYTLTKSSYDRKGVESICTKMFGNVNILDAVTSEIMIVSFEYNTHQPRIFTKYAARAEPSIFNVSLA